MKKAKPLCVVCLKVRARSSVLFCKACAKDYDKNQLATSGSISQVIEWAARRARWFAHLSHTKDPGSDAHDEICGWCGVNHNGPAL